MRRAAAAVLFALLAAGCATSGSGSGSGSGSDSPPPPASTSAAPTPAPTSGSTITVDGVVERGVEPGCLVLKAGTKSYLLQGVQASSAPIAVPVRVSGEVVTDVASYCQQGTPLQVTSLTRR